MTRITKYFVSLFVAAAVISTAVAPSYAGSKNCVGNLCGDSGAWNDLQLIMDYRHRMGIGNLSLENTIQLQDQLTDPTNAEWIGAQIAGCETPACILQGSASGRFRELARGLGQSLTERIVSGSIVTAAAEVGTAGLGEVVVAPVLSAVLRAALPKLEETRRVVVQFARDRFAKEWLEGLDPKIAQITQKALKEITKREGVSTENLAFYRTTKPKYLQGDMAIPNPKSVALIQDPYSPLVPHPFVPQQTMKPVYTAKNLPRPGLNVTTTPSAIYANSGDVLVRIRLRDLKGVRVYNDMGAGVTNAYYLTAEGGFPVEVVKRIP